MFRSVHACAVQLVLYKEKKFPHGGKKKRKPPHINYLKKKILQRGREIIFMP